MARRPEPDMQSETDVNIAKVSDSGYSTGYSNSQSQRSGSSKSTHSHSGSSISSSHGVGPPNGKEFTQPPASKARDSKKKKKKPTATVQEKDEVAIVEVESMETSDSGNMGDSSNYQLKGADVKEEISPPQVFQALNVLATSDAEVPLPEGEVSKPKEPLVKPEFLENVRSESSKPKSDEFFLVVSMRDGKVVYITPTITDVLGFPKDMWLGRSFVDFIHHKDRAAFNNHISTEASLEPLSVMFNEAVNGNEMLHKGVLKPNASVGTQASADTKISKSTFFCCLRKYRGLKTTGFGVKSKEVQYLPFQLSLSFKEASGASTDIFLVITATAVKTAYNRPEECFPTPQFSTRQLANCTFYHVDPEAVSYLGYLPQDIVGRCIFDFYHPEDIHLIKEMYEKVLEGQGVACRSKPYRFRTQNGGYVLLETEWSAFVNPWSRKLEFTIGQHSVCKGPSNPDVFASPLDAAPFSDEVIRESKRVQEGIKYLLNQVYRNWNSELTKRYVSKRCKDLALFIKTLMDEIAKPELDQPESSSGINNTERSISERESGLIGDMSPHHDARSKISSETPPSYRQLNYKENIQRFFESKPKTTLGSGDENKISSTDDDEAGNNTASKPPWQEDSGTSGSGSGQSRQSDQQPVSTSNNKSNSNQPLTMAVLCRHNEDMEKIMLNKHKELRSKDGKGVETRIKKAVEELQDQGGHGVKRSGSDSWEADKILKHRHIDLKPRNTGIDIMNPSNTTVFPDRPMGRDGPYQINPSNFSLWPQQLPVPQPGCPSTSSSNIQIAGMIPIYYITPEAGSTPTIHLGGKLPPSEHPGPPRASPNSFPPPSDPLSMMNSFTMYGPPSMLYSPMMLTPPQPPMQTKPVTFQRPASQATSIKGEPGSPMGSGKLSECSKKAEDPGEESTSPLQDEKSKSGLTGDSGTGDESCYSFSSLLKTDESNRYSSENERSNWGSRPPVKKLQEPPWLEGVNFTSDLVYRYELNPRELSSVLNADLVALKELNQPTTVNNQLQQMYVDLELAGLSADLKLDYDFSSSSATSSENSSGEDALQRTSCRAVRRKKRNYNYAQLVMIYEENMPLPPPPSSVS